MLVRRHVHAPDHIVKDGTDAICGGFQDFRRCAGSVGASGFQRSLGKGFGLSFHQVLSALGESLFAAQCLVPDLLSRRQRDVLIVQILRQFQPFGIGPGIGADHLGEALLQDVRQNTASHCPGKARVRLRSRAFGQLPRSFRTRAGEHAILDQVVSAAERQRAGKELRNRSGELGCAAVPPIVGCPVRQVRHALDHAAA